MKDVVDLQEVKNLEELNNELEALKRENVAAHRTIQKLLRDIKSKNEEIAELQKLLTNAVPLIEPAKKENKIKLEITTEEEIAVLQLERLKQAAQTRSLTLEETRMFDLLVKNKRLSQEEPTNNSPKGKYREVTEIELLQIAGEIKNLSDESDK